MSAAATTHIADASMNPVFFTRSHSQTQSLLLLHRERQYRVLVARPGGHHDELLTRLRSIGHRVCRVVIRNFGTPDLFAGLRLEGVEIAIAATDEYQPTARHHRTAKIA